MYGPYVPLYSGGAAHPSPSPASNILQITLTVMTTSKLG